MKAKQFSELFHFLKKTSRQQLTERRGCAVPLGGGVTGTSSTFQTVVHITPPFYIAMLTHPCGLGKTMVALLSVLFLLFLLLPFSPSHFLFIKIIPCYLFWLASDHLCSPGWPQTHSVAQTGLELSILLHQPSMCWYFRFVPHI